MGRALLPVLSLGVLLRLYGLGYPQLWLDELIQVARSTQPSWSALLQDVQSETAAVPLDYLVQSLFVHLLGTSAWAVRLHAALFGCLSLLLMLRMGRLLLEPLDAPSARWGGLLSLLLTAVYPLHVFYSQEGRNYSLFFFCTLLSFTLLVEALRRRRTAWWMYHSMALLAMLYSNYLGVLALAAQGLFVIAWLQFSGEEEREVRGGKPQRGALFGFLLSASAASLLFLPWLLQTYGRARDVFQEDFWRLGFWLGFVQELSGGSWPLSLLLLFFAGLGLRKLRRLRAWGILALLCCWFLQPVASVIFLDWWRGYFFASRQILFAAPALLLAAALGLGEAVEHCLSRGRRAMAAAAVALTVGLGAGTVLLSSGKQPADWEALDRYLHSQVAEGDLVAAPQIERPVGWRYPEFYRHRAELEELPPRGAWPSQARPGSPASPRIHLVECRYTTPQQRRLIRETLDAAPSVATFQASDFQIYLLAWR